MSPIRAFCLVLLILPGSFSAQAKDTWSGIERIVAIGDLHGDFEQYRAVMRMTGLIDTKGNWKGGRTHLVQTGDIPDRGPDSLKIIRDLQRLGKQARKKRGYVHLLIGNHEAMNITGDLRYVHPGEYEALVDSKSLMRQNRYYENFLRYLADQDSDTVVDDTFRQQWLKQYPPGYVEHRMLWQPGGELADWVAGHNAVIRINDILFVHGGINPHLPLVAIRELNRRIRRELGKQPLPENNLIEDDDSPLWYRGLATGSPATERIPLIRMLDFYGAAHIVIGHTTTRGFVNPRFDGKVIVIDVGIAAHYGKGMAAFLAERGRLYTVHRGKKIPLPEQDASLVPYFREIAQLEPDPAPIERVIRELERIEVPDRSK